jgi:large-conductance mechanosensitive channel
MQTTYDPIKFIEKVEVLTIAVIGSFITIKLLNTLYDNLYEPVIDLVIETEKSDKYYIKIGKYYVKIGVIFKEIIKWIILFFILMILYNLVV